MAAGCGDALASAVDEAAASEDSQATLQLADAAGASVPEDAELLDILAVDLGLEGATGAGGGAAEAEAPEKEEVAAEEGEEATEGGGAADAEASKEDEVDVEGSEDAAERGPMKRPAAARRRRKPKKVRAKYAGPKGPPPKATAKVNAKAAAKEKAMAVAAAKKAPPKFADIAKWMQPTSRAKASGGVPTLRLGESAPSPKDGDGALQVGKAKAKAKSKMKATVQELSSPPSRPRRCTSDTESQASAGMGEEPTAGASPKFRVGAFAALSSPDKRAAPLSLDAVENEFLCDRCDQPCDVMKAYPVRMTKKGQIYRCALCSTRGVQANRAPEWKEMAAKLKDFSIEERVGFWKKIRACSGQSSVKAMVQATLKAIHEKGTRAGKRGGYYPLSWYKRQGFPWRRIKKTCTDTLNHAVMGLCYKVDIHEIEKWEANIARRENEYGASRAAEAEDGLEASGSDDKEPCTRKTPASAQAGAEIADDSAEEGEEESAEDPDSTADVDAAEDSDSTEGSEQLQSGSGDSDSFGLETSGEDSMGDGDGSYGGQPPPVTPGGSNDESNDDGTPPPQNRKMQSKEKPKGKSSKDKEKEKDKSKSKATDKDKDKGKSSKDKEKEKDKSKSKAADKDTGADKDKHKDNDKSKSNGKDKAKDKDKDKEKAKAKSKGKDAGEGKEKDKSKGKDKYKENDKDKRANNDKSKSNGPDKDKGKHKATKKDKDKTGDKADGKDKSKGNKHDKDKSNAKVDGKTKGKKRANEGAAESSTKKMKKQKPPTSSSQSGSDIDSGSSSPAHPRVGETAKERAAREKQEKKEQSKKDKEAQQQKLLATRTLSRIVAPMYKLESALKCDGVGKIPEATLVHAKKLMDTLAKMKKVAHKVSSGKVAPSEFTWSAQDVSDMSTQAAAQSTLVMSMAKAYLVTAKSS